MENVLEDLKARRVLQKKKSLYRCPATLKLAVPSSISSTSSVLSSTIAYYSKTYGTLHEALMRGIWLNKRCIQQNIVC